MLCWPQQLGSDARQLALLLLDHLGSQGICMAINKLVRDYPYLKT